MKRIGFIGTRLGMTPQQTVTVAGLFSDAPSPSELHVSGNRGADYSARVLAKITGIHVVAHDSSDARDRDIVDATDELIVCPYGFREALRSTTWDAVRRALRGGKRVIIVWPDGSTEERADGAKSS